MTFFSLSGLFIAISSSILSIFILFKAKNKIHFVWALFCLSVVLWGIGVFEIGIKTNQSLALFWWKFSYIGVIFIPILYLHFIFEFLKRKNKIIIYSLYLFSLLFLFLDIFTDFFIKKTSLLFDKIYYITNPTFFYDLFVCFFFLIVIYAIFILNKAQKNSQGHLKNQIRYFLLASYIGYFGGAFSFLPVYGINIYPFLNFLIAAFPFIIVYSIFKYQLMDVRVALQISLIYSLSLAIIISLYIFVLMILGILFPQVKELVTPFAAGVTVIIGIYGVPIIEKYFRRKTDKIFFKDKYDFSQAIFELSQVLNKNLNLDSLLAQISIKIQEIMKAKYFRILFCEAGLVFDRQGKFRETEERKFNDFYRLMESKNISVLNILDLDQMIKQKDDFSPRDLQHIKIIKKYFKKYNLQIGVFIYVENKIIAWFLLGDKMSREIYSQEDCSLLKTFSYQAGVAMEKAKLFGEVKDYSMHLEQRVKQRTSKIEGLQKEQEQMVHEMAHGLQTPLTILKSELAQISGTVKDQKKFKMLERSIDRISKMIYDMLRLAKLESGKQDEEFSKVNLSELLLELIESFEIITQAQNIILKYKVEPNLWIWGNVSELEELITNLVSNSVKYINDKGIKRINLDLTVSGNKINLNISDTGIGMSKDTLQHLFKRFYRAKNEPKYSKKGTGLGLVIAKKIIEKHQGKIEVQSELGKGTKFLLVFTKK